MAVILVRLASVQESKSQRASALVTVGKAQRQRRLILFPSPVDEGAGLISGRGAAEKGEGNGGSQGSPGRPPKSLCGAGDIE
jgi:hypothetical protein